MLMRACHCELQKGKPVFLFLSALFFISLRIRFYFFAIFCHTSSDIDNFSVRVSVENVEGNLLAIERRLVARDPSHLFQISQKPASLFVLYLRWRLHATTSRWSNPTAQADCDHQIHHEQEKSFVFAP